MCTDKLRFYAATHEGIFTLTGTGEGCTVESEHLRGEIVDCVHPRHDHPEIVFAGVTHDGLYRSQDGGKSWAKLLNGDLRAIAVDPSDVRVIYAGPEPVHLYRSEDGGDTWQELTSLQSLPADTRKKH